MDFQPWGQFRPAHHTRFMHPGKCFNDQGHHRNMDVQTWDQFRPHPLQFIYPGNCLNNFERERTMFSNFSDNTKPSPKEATVESNADEFHFPVNMDYQAWGQFRPPHHTRFMHLNDLGRRTNLFSNFLENTKTPSRESTVVSNQKQFKIVLDVSQFKSEELSITVIENRTIKIEGKHEERDDEYGTVSRYFLRKYVVPEAFDMSKMESKLSPSGRLCITVAATAAIINEEIHIPIIRDDN